MNLNVLFKTIKAGKEDLVSLANKYQATTKIPGMLKNLPNKWLNLSLLLIILLSTDIYSQVSRANYQILGITVEGNKSADANTIIANTG